MSALFFALAAGGEGGEGGGGCIEEEEKVETGTVGRGEESEEMADRYLLVHLIVRITNKRKRKRRGRKE